MTSATEKTEIRLYLDDERLCPAGWTAARSYAAAVSLMEDPNLSVVAMSLDHDLGACPECVSSNPEAARTLHCRHVPTGYDFALWMVEKGRLPERRPSVHSMNPVGRTNINQLLDRWYRNGERAASLPPSISPQLCRVTDLKPGMKVPSLSRAPFVFEAAIPAPLHPGHYLVVFRKEGSEEFRVDLMAAQDCYELELEA